MPSRMSKRMSATSANSACQRSRKKPVNDERSPEAVAIFIVCACFAAEGGTGVAQRGALRRRVARGEGLAASPIGVGAWRRGAAPRDSPSLAASLPGRSMRCRLFQNRACVPALCRPNVAVCCGREAPVSTSSELGN